MNKKEKSHMYYLKNKDKILERNKKWDLLNIQRRKEQKQEYYLKNKSDIDKQHREYHNKNKDVINEKHRNERDIRINYEKTWRERNPEKILLKYKRKINTMSKILNLESTLYLSAVLSWSKTVKKRDNNQCQICGLSEKLNSHHILYKSNYPKLSLNSNNGITLCITHHKEVHLFDRWGINGQ